MTWPNLLTRDDMTTIIIPPTKEIGLRVVEYLKGLRPEVCQL